MNAKKKCVLYFLHYLHFLSIFLSKSIFISTEHFPAFLAEKSLSPFIILPNKNISYHTTEYLL